jgi:LPS sulfotransferase NodH
MTGGFDLFVILADMRSGSNFLERNLNDLAGVRCHGEAFNPAFLGRPSRQRLLGMTKEERDLDPLRLLTRMRRRPGLRGFRLFQDHDARVLSAVIEDPRCAKIVLWRAPLDSYLSLEIARRTGQWQLTRARDRKAAKVVFDEAGYRRYVLAHDAYYTALRRRLQDTGQTAFWIAYDDIQRVTTINGLAAWLGVSARLAALNGDLLRQNPESAGAKVTNPDALRAVLP